VGRERSGSSSLTPVKAVVSAPRAPRGSPSA
jgi:hypothetical protein